MRYAVTGAAGFIGSHLAEALVEAGHEVVGLDSFTDYYDPELKEENARGLDMRRLDLAADELDFAGFDGVFHLAGQPGVRSFGDVFPLYLRRNVLATQRLFEAAAAAGVRVVWASSSSVYGDAESYPTREDADPRPRSPYGITKLACEHLARAYAADFGLDAVALRYFTVYGPRQRPDMAFTRIMRAALSGRAVPLYGSGAQRRDFTHVSDAVAATIAAASCEARAEVVNVASGSSVPLVQAVRRIASLAGAEVPSLRRAAQPGDADVTAADLARARDLLGYEPRVDLANGLRTQWEWLTAQERPGQPVAAEAAL